MFLQEERKEIVSSLFSQLDSGKDQEALENVAYILIETVKRNTSGNSGREVVAFILEETNVNLIFAQFEKATLGDSRLGMISLELLLSLIEFCLQEETRNNYKSPFVNCDLENECEKLCREFLRKLEEKLPLFLAFLKEKACEGTPINTSWKQRVTVFGVVRLKVIEMLTELLRFKNDRLLAKMVDNAVFQTLFVSRRVLGGW